MDSVKTDGAGGQTEGFEVEEGGVGRCAESAIDREGTAVTETVVFLVCNWLVAGKEEEVGEDLVAEFWG